MTVADQTFQALMEQLCDSIAAAGWRVDRMNAFNLDCQLGKWLIWTADGQLWHRWTIILNWAACVLSLSHYVPHLPPAGAGGYVQRYVVHLEDPAWPATIVALMRAQL